MRDAPSKQELIFKNKLFRITVTYASTGPSLESVEQNQTLLPSMIFPFLASQFYRTKYGISNTSNSKFRGTYVLTDDT